MRRFKNLFPFAALLSVLSLAALFTCDMDAVLDGWQNVPAPIEFHEPEPEGPFDPLDPGSNPYFPDLDPAYNYLFILNVPENTAASHLSKVAVANAGGVIARCASYSAVLASDAAALAVPLSYNSGASFTETGLFAVGFDITVDAVSRVSFDVKEGRLVRFKGGNGILDLNDIPPSVPMPDVPGRYLTVLNLPPNTQSGNISGVSVENTVRQIAKCKSYAEISVKENAAFIPLVYPDNGEFTENGMFYVSLLVAADAANTVSLSKKDGILVNFYEGSGVLDLRNLPVSMPPPAEPGTYLSVINIPRNTMPSNFSAVKIGLSSKNVTAFCSSYKKISVSEPAAYIPLAYTDGTAPFSSTGDFFAALAIDTDAFNRISITLNEKVAVHFYEGNGVLDLAAIKKDILAPDPSDPDDPSSPDYQPLPGELGTDPDSGVSASLTVLNLPPNTSASSFSSVQINDAYSAVARCAAYNSVKVSGSTAVIPLAAFNDQPFGASGYFYFSFVINVDINTGVTVRPNDKKIAFFANGSAVVDLDNLQTEYFDPLNPDATIQSTVILINLLDETSPLNISDVFVGNSSATVARSVDQADFSVLGNTAFIPVTYVNGAAFTESGNFYVSFTVTVDALTTVKRTLANKCLYHFSNGGTVIDLASLPPVQEHNLTLFNLPVYTITPNVSEATVYDLNGNLASTAKLENISVKNGAAVIPLVYKDDTKIDFFGTGAFYISFTVTVDAVTKIVASLEDHILVNFSDGNGEFDITHIPKKPDDPHNLILYNLPANAMAPNIAFLRIYNTQEKIAEWDGTSPVTVANSQAVVPLANAADGTPFVMDGFFFLELSVNVDALHQYAITREQNSLCEFYNGNGSLDIQSVSAPGHFSGGLLNETDAKAPVLKAGTAFEINGGFVKLQDNLPFAQINRDDGLKIVYLYAYETGQNLEQNYRGVRAQGTYQNIDFTYSVEDPVFDAKKNAWYRGNARALFKFLFVRETAVSNDKYLFKTYAKDDFPAFKAVISAAGGELLETYSGADNRPPASRNLPSGFYCFELSGAGGGGGTGASESDSGSQFPGGGGGDGGYVVEAVYFPAPRILEVFTGSGGQGGYRCMMSAGGSGGGGGGGGGSGSYIATTEYLLCAGGGGGGGGSSSSYAGGGGGGAGGSIGPGGGGGAGRTDRWWAMLPPAFPFGPPGYGGAYGYILASGGGDSSGPSGSYHYHYGGGGGRGGGKGGGEGGYQAEDPATFTRPSHGEHGSNTDYGIGNYLGFGGAGGKDHEFGPAGNGGGAAYYSNTIYAWKNTNSANGSGGSGAPYYVPENWLRYIAGNGGGHGGNNRNSARAGGGRGGPGSVIEKEIGSIFSAAGTDGAPGYVKIYKIK